MPERSEVVREFGWSAARCSRWWAPVWSSAAVLLLALLLTLHVAGADRAGAWRSRCRRTLGRLPACPCACSPAAASPIGHQDAAAARRALVLGVHDRSDAAGLPPGGLTR